MLSKLQVAINKNRILLLLIVFLSLFLPGKFNSYAIILFVAQWLFFVPKAEKITSFKKNRIYLIPFLVYFVLFGISILYSENKASGLKDLESKLSLLIFPLIIFCQKPLSSKEWKKFFKVFTYSVISIGLLAVAMSFYQFKTLFTNQELSSLVNMHASYLSAYIAVGFFYVLHLIIKREGTLKVNSILVMLASILLVILATRIVILSTVVILIMWFAIIRFDLKKLMFIVGSILLLSVVAVNLEGVSNRIEEAVKLEEVDFENPIENGVVKVYGGTTIRLAIWKCAKDVVERNWLLGVGSGDVHHHLQQSYKDHNFVLAWEYNNFNSHNLYLETVIAVGIFGLIALLMIFFQLFSRALRNKDFHAFSFVLLFLLFSIMEASLNVQRGIVFFVLMSCLFLSKKYGLKQLEKY